MIIGIGGVSRAGKTTLANQLKNHLKGKSIIAFNQDDFVKKNNLPLIKNHIDWEHPDSLDWKALEESVQKAKIKFDIVLVEGLFAFTHKSLVKLYDHALFVTIGQELFLTRKRNDIRWGKEPEWFITHIWDSFIQYGQVPKQMKQVIVLHGNKKPDITLLLDIMKISH